MRSIQSQTPHSGHLFHPGGAGAAPKEPARKGDRLGHTEAERLGPRRMLSPCAPHLHGHIQGWTFNRATQRPPSARGAGGGPGLSSDGFLQEWGAVPACRPVGSHRPCCVPQVCGLRAGWVWVGVGDGLAWVAPLSGRPPSPPRASRAQPQGPG